MNSIPEAEARSLVSQPLFCEDIGNWTPMRVQPGTMICGAGVLNKHGESVKMYVEFDYRNTYKTKIKTYLFTLYKRFPYGKERIYQLDVIQTPKRIKDLHRLSHEHMGGLRTTGDASWADWGYDEVLAHFSARTNITFQPKPLHPEDFRLDGR